MPDLDTQRAILQTETYWFGGPLGAPKVYDSGTNFHAYPNLRGVSPARLRVWAGPESTGRAVTYVSIGDDVSITVEEA